MNMSYKQSAGALEKTNHIAQAHARYNAFFFGPFRITRDEQPLGEPNWRRNKAKALLKWFLLNPGDLFSVEQLSRLFWPESSQKVATSNLHVTLHYLRYVLEPDLEHGKPSTFVRRNRHNYYWFDLGGVWWSDVSEVEYLSTRAKEAERRENLAETIALSNQLLAYYNLGFLPEDIYEDAFSPYRRQHEYTYIRLIEHLLQLYVRVEQQDEALSCALHLLSVDPYNENAVKAMVHIYLHQGNITGALRQLNDFQRSLQQDLGVEPEGEVLTLRETILRAR